MILVSSLLLLSSLYSAEASVFKKAREGVLDAVSPALEFLSRPIAWVQERFGDVGDYFNHLEQNQALREENAELRQWMHEAIRLREEIAAYERLQENYAALEAQPIDGFVIGEANDAFSHSMLVNAGVTDGVRRGQAVVDDQGLVGHIVDVGRRASRILLLTDVQSRIPVFVEDAGVEGILVGRSIGRPAISFTANTEAPAFIPGQRVLTSGAGGALPRGLQVGVIVGEDDGSAVVDLYSNYARTRLVRVINYDFPSFEPAEGANDIAPIPASEQTAPAGAAASSEPPAAEPAPTLASQPSSPVLANEGD